MDDSFLDHQFKIDGYQFPPFRRNRNKFGGGRGRGGRRRGLFMIKMIVKRLNGFETNISETISLELTISNKKWFMIFGYRPPTPLIKQYINLIISSY